MDYSFIRLEPTIELADKVNDSIASSITYTDAVSLSPNKIYKQVTSTKLGISFDGNYQVLIIDKCNNVLLDISEKVAIEQFTDANGLPQIKFEIAPILNDFYDTPVRLKFMHTVSDYVWFSQLFEISDYYSNVCTEFDYRNYNTTNDEMLSIRLKCLYTTPLAEATAEQYTRIDGLKVSSKQIVTQLEKYRFDMCNNFTFLRVNNLLSMPVIYIDGKRVTNKAIAEVGDRQMDANTFDANFTVAINYDETFEREFTIFEPLGYETTPIDNGFYSSIDAPLLITFNRNCNIIDTTLKAYLYKNGVLVETIYPNILDNVLSLNFVNAFENGEYYVLLDANKIKSEFNELFAGINDSEVWNFTIADGEFEISEFDNDEFLV